MPIGLVPLRIITPPHVKDNAPLSRVDITKEISIEMRNHFKSHLKKPFTIAHTATAKEDFVKQQLSGRTGDCHRLKSLEQTTFPYITREEKLEVFGIG